jgi:hypothetical protein
MYFYTTWPNQPFVFGWNGSKWYFTFWRDLEKPIEYFDDYHAAASRVHESLSGIERGGITEA